MVLESRPEPASAGISKEIDRCIYIYLYKGYKMVTYLVHGTSFLGVLFVLQQVVQQFLQ